MHDAFLFFVRQAYQEKWLTKAREQHSKSKPGLTLRHILPPYLHHYYLSVAFQKHVDHHPQVIGILSHPTHLNMYYVLVGCII